MLPAPTDVTPARNLRLEFKALWRLAGPVIGVQIGMMAMGLVDTMMVGHLSRQALGAVALGHLYTWALLAFGLGILTAVDPIVSQAVGAKDRLAARLGVQRGMILVVVLSLPIMAAMLPVRPILALLQQQDELLGPTTEYVQMSIPGVMPFLLFTLLRIALQAHARIAATVYAIVFANIVNVILNYGLIFGHLGFPALGVKGAALATVLSRWAMAAALFWIARKELMALVAPFCREALSIAPLWRVLRLGTPIGLQFQLEMGAFALTALLIGQFGTMELGGHQVALNLASFAFMVPLGISFAAAVRVGHAVGAADLPATRRAATAALWSGGIVMLLSGTLFFTMPGLLAAAYTTDQAVLSMAVTLLPLAALFQVFDGVQVVAIGVLRGLGDTKTPFFVNLLGFWAIGIPVGLWLCYTHGMGPVGLWWGLVLGLFAVAVILLLRIPKALQSGISRLAMDGVAPRTDHPDDERSLSEPVHAADRAGGPGPTRATEPT